MDLINYAGIIIRATELDLYPDPCFDSFNKIIRDEICESPFNSQGQDNISVTFVFHFQSCLQINNNFQHLNIHEGNIAMHQNDTMTGNNQNSGIMILRKKTLQ